VHPLVQDGDDADVAVGQPSPVDDMTLVTEEVPVDAELRRNRPRCDAVGIDAFERIEPAGDVALGLRIAPALAGVAIDLVQAPGRRLLDANLGKMSPVSTSLNNTYCAL
jgi:hypothetical protein